MRKWIKTYITERKLQTDTEIYLKHIHVSVDRVSLYLFLKILLRQVIKHDLNSRATSVAFSLTLSIFPFLLFLLALLPFLPINQAQIMEFLADAIPKGIYSFIDTTISDILINKRQNLLSLSIILQFMQQATEWHHSLRVLIVRSNMQKNAPFCVCA